MRVYLTFLAALACLGLGLDASAQVSRGKAKLGPKVVSPPDIKPAIPKPVIQAEKPRPYLSIDSFTAQRKGSDYILVGGMLSNPNLQAVNNVAYFIDQWNGGGWSNLNRGSISIKGRGTAYVSFNARDTDAAVKYRIYITDSVEKTREASLPQRTWAVRFRCLEWQMYKDVNTAQILIEKYHLKKLSEMGFQGRSERSTDWVHNGRTVVYYRAPAWVQRAFPDRRSAEAFFNTIPWKGVEKTIVVD